MNYADLGVLCIVAYLSVLGWQKGIVRFSLGFVAMGLASFAALYFFKTTYRIIPTIVILVLGSVFLYVALSFLLPPRQVGQQPHRISKILGGALGFSWACLWAVMLTLLLLIVPAKDSRIQKAKDLTRSSFTFFLLQDNVVNKVPALKTLFGLVAVTQISEELPQMSEDRIQDIRSSREFEAVMENPRVQDLFHDDALRDALTTKDIPAFLSNPKVQKLLKDEDLMKSLQGLYLKVIKEGSSL